MVRRRSARKIRRADFSISMPAYGEELIGAGMESVIRPIAGKRLVHKVFKPGWITRNYAMGGRLRWISRKAFSLALAIRDPQPPKKGRHGFSRLPPEQWEKITLLLANHSVDVLRTAKELSIPVPKTFRCVCVRGRSGKYWVLEMTNLRKRGTALFDADTLEIMHRKKPDANPAKNYAELRKAIEEDSRKLARKGFFEDKSHIKYGSWLIRVNRRTGIGERFLVDATNFRAYYKK